MAVQPETQIVRPMLAWLTEGLTAPAVRAEFGMTAPAALTVMPPWVGIGLRAAGVVGAATVLGVVTAAVVGGDETVLDDEVGGDAFAGLLGVEPPQPDSSTTAASTAVRYAMVFFMVSGAVFGLRCRSRITRLPRYR